jgi:hypothetical protein
MLGLSRLSESLLLVTLGDRYQLDDPMAIGVR